MKLKLPDKNGYFKNFGGRYVPETLIEPLIELEESYKKIVRLKKFKRELNKLRKHYTGRPTPLYFSEKLSNITGVKIYLKREDLLHTGAHKINNTLGQLLLAKYMGKTRVIAETGAGQHGVATATAAAILDLQCTIYMGAKDIKRQKTNVVKMKFLGAEIIPVKSGSQTLKDAINEALRDWVSNIDNTFYCIGSVVGPHPYPLIVRNFQKIIGEEVKKQILKYENRFPDILIACVGGGSNSIGLFYPFLKEKNIVIIGVEGGGKGLNSTKHSASLSCGGIGVFHGSKSYFLYDSNGNILPAHSISAGLDYPGVGPEHAYLKEIKRVKYISITDSEALEAFELLTKNDGIIPALESSHAIAAGIKIAKSLKKKKDKIIVINLSGRGDKDLDIVLNYKNNKIIN